MKNNSLSMIIPAYNAEKYIGECLESLRKLSFIDMEIIVVNDGSHDNTVSIVEKNRKMDARIKLLTTANNGVSHARNVGIDNASGNYIMFLDADDYLLDDSFELLQRLVGDQEVDYSAFSREIVDTNCRKWNDKFCFDEECTSDKCILDNIMYADSHFNECWGKLYKKEIIDNYNIRFPEGIPIGEDMMFVMEYYSHCKTVFATNIALVAYRQHAGSAMRRYSIVDRLKFSQSLFDYAKKYLPEKLEDDFWFYNFKILTNLCREYSNLKADIQPIRCIYQSDMADEIMKKIKVGTIPKFRLHEYIMMRFWLYRISAVYYHLKSLLHK